MGHSSLDHIELVVQTIAQTAIEQEKYFSDLDSVVGDGDFGYSLARGFEKLTEEWENLDRRDIGTFLKKVSMIVTGRIGGTSGPIWGTGFMRAGMAAGNKTTLTSEDVVAMLRAAIEGIKARGQAELGDKTLLDSLVPAVDQLEQSFTNGDEGSEALQQAARVARERAEATKELLAKRGRAAYSGERSIGTVDAGAMAIAVMFEAINAAWQKNITKA